MLILLPSIAITSYLVRTVDSDRTVVLPQKVPVAPLTLGRIVDFGHCVDVT